MTSNPSGLSLVIPAFEEEEGIGAVLAEAEEALRSLDIPHEIIVVDDHSGDRTAEIAEAAGATVVRNPERGGYGYALMRGIRRARYPAVAIADADGSYPLRDLPRLFAHYREGVLMVVGARQGRHLDTSSGVRLGRRLFRLFTEFIVGRRVPDLNSGMRIFERDAVLPLFPYMSNGYSFTTSITLLFMLNALPVRYVPIEYRPRRGRSKVRLVRDSLRALQIVVSIAVRLNPIKIFLLGAILNLGLLAPLLWLWPGREAAAVAVAVTAATSVLLLAAGIALEGLIDKRQFLPAARRTEEGP